MLIYLDNAATTKMAPEVREAMLPWLTEKFGNPSAITRPGEDAKDAVAKSRRQTAALIGAEPEEIYFTSGGTESDNWALTAVFDRMCRKGRHIITTAIEHPAILRTCEYLAQTRGAKITVLPVDKYGYVRPEDVEAAITDQTILISVMTANNEIGTIEPVREIGKIAHSHGILMHTDAVQAFGQIPVSVKELDVDLLSASGHKLNGPQGTGILYIRKGLKLGALIHGGAQERNRRAGTENVPGIVGLGAAAERAARRLPEKIRKETERRDYLIRRIREEISHVHLNGPDPCRDDDFSGKEKSDPEENKAAQEELTREDRDLLTFTREEREYFHFPEENGAQPEEEDFAEEFRDDFFSKKAPEASDDDFRKSCRESFRQEQKDVPSWEKHFLSGVNKKEEKTAAAGVSRAESYTRAMWGLDDGSGPDRSDAGNHMTEWRSGAAGKAEDTRTGAGGWTGGTAEPRKNGAVTDGNPAGRQPQETESAQPQQAAEKNQPPRLPNNVNFSFEFTEGESLVIMLDMKGIAASSGSACSSGSLSPSHVLKAVGLSDDLAQGAVRFTLSEDTTEEELDRTVDVLKTSVERLRGISTNFDAYLQGIRPSETGS